MTQDEEKERTYVNKEYFIRRVGKCPKGVSESTNRTVSKRGCDSSIIMWKMCRL